MWIKNALELNDCTRHNSFDLVYERPHQDRQSTE